jgi:hypothetical protein
MVMKSSVLLEKLVDDGIILLMRGLFSLTLDGATHLFLQNSNILRLFLVFLPPAVFYLFSLFLESRSH